MAGQPAGVTDTEAVTDTDQVVLRAPGIMLGVGLGGFVDGILLHQILQWHHLLSSTDSDHVGLPHVPPDTVAGLRVNTLADGAFHVLSWLFVVAGVALLARRVAAPRRRAWASRVLWGWALVGWGVFNLVEGIVNHHLLGIHHVRGGPHQLWYDLGFLAFGAVLVAAGWLLQRRARTAP